MENMNDEKVEQGVIDAYMDSDNYADILTEEDRLNYLQVRYENIKANYKLLCLQNDEAKGIKENQEAIQNKIRAAFHENYLQRKYVVRKLREFGKAVSDPFITT